MHLPSTLLLLALRGSLAAAQDLAAPAVLSAQVAVFARSGSADGSGTNTTISVFLSATPQTNAALGAVSTLYLVGAAGAAVESITCTPFRNANGTGAGGLPFTVGRPSLLSTNTVVVGSLVCQSSTAGTGTGASSASSVTTSGSNSTITTASPSASTPPASTQAPPSTVVMTTVTDSSGSVSVGPSTVTTVVAAASPTTSAATRTTTNQPTLNTGAAGQNGFAWSFMGLAVAAGALAAGV